MSDGILDFSKKFNSKEQPPQQNINIDPNTLPDIKCENCGHTIFEPGIKFKKVSAIISPNGQEGVVPNQILICKKCGTELNIN